MCTAPRLGLELYRLFDITADHWKERRTPIFVGSVSKTVHFILQPAYLKANMQDYLYCYLYCGLFIV